MKEKKVEIIFAQRCEVQDGSGVVFEEGEIVTMPEPSANHWISRNKARVTVPADHEAPEENVSGKDDPPATDSTLPVTEFTPPFTEHHQAFGNWQVLDATGKLAAGTANKADEGSLDRAGAVSKAAELNADAEL